MMALTCVSCLCEATAVILRRSHRKLRTLHKRVYSSQRQSHAEQCMEKVRKYDYENFLTSLLLPSASRSAAFAIRAFNVEISQIRDLVSDRTIGQMRIQFWRDSIDKIFMGQPPQSPVAQELARAVHRHKLSKRWLTRLLDARADNLNDQVFGSLREVEEYGEKTVSSVLYLILQSLGVEDLEADHAASHVGKAIGITTLLRAVPFNAQQQRCYLPQDILIMHGVSQEDVLRGSQGQATKDVAYDVASQAHTHLEHARSMRSKVPRASLPVLLPAVCCDKYLKRLREVNFDLFNGQLQQRNNWLPLALMINKWRRGY